MMGLNKSSKNCSLCVFYRWDDAFNVHVCHKDPIMGVALMDLHYYCVDVCFEPLYVAFVPMGAD